MHREISKLLRVITSRLLEPLSLFPRLCMSCKKLSCIRRTAKRILCSSLHLHFPSLATAGFSPAVA
jgi:hypothetical protein